jgi:hypothetical protein
VGSTRSAKSRWAIGGGGKPIIWLDVNDWDPTKIVLGGKTQL